MAEGGGKEAPPVAVVNADTAIADIDAVVYAMLTGHEKKCSCTSQNFICIQIDESRRLARNLKDAARLIASLARKP